MDRRCRGRARPRAADSRRCRRRSPRARTWSPSPDGGSRARSDRASLSFEDLDRSAVAQRMLAFDHDLLTGREPFEHLDPIALLEADADHAALGFAVFGDVQHAILLILD